MISRKTGFSFILVFLGTISVLTAQSPLYLDPSASVDDRVNDLLSRMTLEEKVGQMTQADNLAIKNLEDIKTFFLGSVLSGGGSDPDEGDDPISWANLYDRLQQKALETRLKIPLIYGIDAVHGHNNVTDAVIFPHNIGLGATRNPDLIEQASRVTAIEIAATGIDWTFAPCLAVPRDERWGRTYEGFGETPKVVEMLAGASVKGFQRDSLNHPTSIVACAKHFIGDGGTIGGQNTGNTVLTEEELRSIHLPGYLKALENDVKTIMASYSSWNGEKLHGHKYLLTDVLKKELEFKGFIVSDWMGIDRLPGDYTSDIETAINAGIDMVMVPNEYATFFTSLVSLVEQNRVTLARIDDAVKRILKVKFELGLFERPLADRSLLPLIGSKDHRAVARQCVRESQVLLKKNDTILPLAKKDIKILVAGKHADDIGLQCGGWSIEWQGASGAITDGTTVLEGLRKVAPDVEFVFDADGNFKTCDADYAIAVIGEQPYAEGAGDTNDLTINQAQIHLVHKLKKMGLPVITLLISGRPMIINPVLHDSDLLIASWLPGTEADGIAEILFGDYAPTGLLPMTWPKSMEQIPINYGDDDYSPLFQYGFGITDISDSQAGTPPIFQSAMLTKNGYSLELAFNKSMSLDDATNARFEVIKNNSTPVEVKSYKLSDLNDRIIELLLEDEISKDDDLTVSYVGGNLSSRDGGNLAPFPHQSVINFRQVMLAEHQLPGRIEAEDYINMFGVQTEITSDAGGGLNVGWIDDGDWVEYLVHFESTGVYLVIFRTACLSNPGKIQFLVNNEVVFSKTIPVTNGWQNWTTVTERGEFAQGPATLKILAEKGGFNLNWLEFVLLTEIEEKTDQITEFRLAQNYPNPFNPHTTIEYTIGCKGYETVASDPNVQLLIYDALGQVAAILVDEKQKPGSYVVEFNGSDFASGIYFYQLKTSSVRQTKKFLLIK
ncbi:glycoside hydrolase family 3 C-terminal domain-containing protein [candidate division KSB1 bacterium]|nr:glycoside hydrolase family 3 C-terminal domain-containing protein [candidate division KSB1 bacterium]